MQDAKQQSVHSKSNASPVNYLAAGGELLVSAPVIHSHDLALEHLVGAGCRDFGLVLSEAAQNADLSFQICAVLLHILYTENEPCWHCSCLRAGKLQKLVGDWGKEDEVNVQSAKRSRGN
jgi:hypothetical protein